VPQENEIIPQRYQIRIEIESPPNQPAIKQEHEINAVAEDTHDAEAVNIYVGNHRQDNTVSTVKE
jgi:hypothetical protein